MCSRLFVGLVAFLWTSCAGALPQTLLYVPLHIQEGTEVLASFLNCTFYGPNGALGVEVDFLLVTSGRKQHTDSIAIDRAVQRLSKHGDVRNAFFHHLLLEDDTYDRARSTAKWVNGPNSVFYNVFVEGGSVYERYTSNYQYVLQLETDVCAIKPYWLLGALQEAQESQAVVTGSTIKGSCAYDDATAECGRYEDLPDYIKYHINGNALYRIDKRLQELLGEAIARYGDWPFDLAIWLAANATGKTKGLQDTPKMVNVARPVDREGCFSTSFFSKDVMLAHIPYGRRVDALAAGLATIDSSLPVTITFVSDSHTKFLHLLLKQMETLGVHNVLVFVFSAKLNFRLRTRYPGTEFVLVKSMATKGSTTYKSHEYYNVVNQKTHLAYSVLERGYSIFCVDADVYIQHNYENFIASLPQDRVYFSSESVAGTGLMFAETSSSRYYFNAGVYYIPFSPKALEFMQHWVKYQKATGEDEQQLLNKILQCTALSNCTWSGVDVEPLPQTLFQNGMNGFVKLWPNPEAAQNAYITHNNWADGLWPKLYRYRLRKMVDSEHKSVCMTASKFPAERLTLSPETAGPSMLHLLGFFLFLRAHNIPCGVIPALVIKGTDWVVPFEILFNYNKVSELSGAHFYPAEHFVDAGNWVDYTGWSVGKSDLDPDLFEVSFTKPLLHMYIKNMMVDPFVCVVDNQRHLEEVVLTHLRGELPSVAGAIMARVPRNASKIFLTGKWRILSKDIAGISPRIVTTGINYIPPNLHATFGLPFMYGEYGVDLFHDIVETFICHCAETTLWLSELVPRLQPLTKLQIVRRVLEHIPPAVLAEDLQALHQHPQLLASMRERRHLIALEKVGDNGFSNVENALQSITYIANTTKSACFFLPLSKTHLIHEPVPWMHAIDTNAFYEAFPYVLPTSLAVILYPALLLRSKQYQTPIVQTVLRNETTVIASKYRHVVEALMEFIETDNSRAFTSPPTWTISHGEGEDLLMRGHFATVPKHPYLGMSDDEIMKGMTMFPSRSPIAMSRAFRAVNFQVDNPQHQQFSAAWLSGFKVAPNVLQAAENVRQQLQQPYACLHMRLKQEYLDSQDPALPHSTKEGSQGAAAQWIQSYHNHSYGLFICKDVADSDFSASIQGLPHVLGAHCEDFPQVCALVDREVCIAADSFAGNIYSTFSLSICGKRQDHHCLDMYGRGLMDGRLLF